jgi:NAD(P)-dependent dehydrogenase (short-subunit alcohol dehydrogenase family)
MQDGAVVVIGGTSGLGLGVARRYVERGRRVVLSSRDPARAAEVASGLGKRAAGVAVDLTEPEGIAPALGGIGPVDRLVIAAIDRDENTLRDYAPSKAVRLATLKLVGYTEVVHALMPNLSEDASVLFFGGLAKERPYPGSTTVTTVNAAVTGMVRSLMHELAPVRVNSIHPAFVVDTPYWMEKTEALERAKAATPSGRLVTTDDVVDAAIFLLENPGMNGTDLFVDGGWALP